MTTHSIVKPAAKPGSFPIKFILSTIYLVALYWAVTTMTTVGYGDIKPMTNQERAFTIVAMMVGCAIYGYIIATMASVVTSQDQMQKVRYTQESNRLVAFVIHR